jgi:hypothetical protein
MVYDGVTIGVAEVTIGGADAGSAMPGCGGATANGEDITGGATTAAPGAGTGVILPTAGVFKSARSSSVNGC